MCRGSIYYARVFIRRLCDLFSLCALDYCSDKIKSQRKVKKLESMIAEYELKISELEEEIAELEAKLDK